MATINKLYVANLALSMVGGKALTAFPSTTGSTNEANAIYHMYDITRDMFLMEHLWSFAQKTVALVDITRPEVDSWVTATAYEVDDVVLAANGYYYICLVAHTSDVIATDLTAVNWQLYTSWVTDTAYVLDDNVYYAGVNYSCVANHTSGTWATDLAVPDWVVTYLIPNMNDNMTYIYRKPTDLLKHNYISHSSAVTKFQYNGIVSDTDGLVIQYTYQNDDPTTYKAKAVYALATLLASNISVKVAESERMAELFLKRYQSIDIKSAMAEDSKQSTPLQPNMYEWESAMLRSGQTFYAPPGAATWHPPF